VIDRDQLLAKGTTPTSKIRRIIEQYGVFIYGVACDPPEPFFHYTIGLHGAGLPELLAIGGDENHARIVQSVVNALAELMLERKKPFHEGELVQLGGKWPVKIINVATADVTDTHTCQVEVFYGIGPQDYAVQQVLLPDPKGRYPGDPDCAQPYASWRVPVIKPAGQELH
jgi:hypothetical protein